MPHTIIKDPFVGPHGTTLTPFHLVVLFFGAITLAASQLELSPELEAGIGMWRRTMVLLVVGLVGHAIISSQISIHQSRTARLAESVKTRDLGKEKKFDKQANAWENMSSHPSQYLTTKDGKPRLFPFPLGKAGGLKGELWWEAGNAAHVGHFNQREDPGGQDALKDEAEEKEAKRAAKAREALKAYSDAREKWTKRLGHLKILCMIVVIGIFHKLAAMVCLAGLIYYVLAAEVLGMLKPPAPDEPKEKATRRRKTPKHPGMAMTYIYEPAPEGGVREAGSIPVKAPSHRLMTTTDNRYAS